MHVNQTYCSDHFIIYTNIESLCYTPEINMLYVKYNSKKNKINLRVTKIAFNKHFFKTK